MTTTTTIVIMAQIFLSFCIIILSKTCFLLQYRKYIIQNKLWKLQFICHPLLIGTLIAFGSATFTIRQGYDEDDNDDGYQRRDDGTDNRWYNFIVIVSRILIIPIAFNFGVEPYDMSDDFIFQFCFYLHHLAPILQSSSLSSSSSSSSSMSLRYDTLSSSQSNINKEGILHYNISWEVALLFAHAWTMHPIGYFDKKKWSKRFFDKQKLFWPYILLGFIVKYYWWKSIQIQQHQRSMQSIIFVVCQYVGRWGLYLRLCYLYGWHRRTHPNYDSFEWRKQYAELASFIIAFFLVRYE